MPNGAWWPTPPLYARKSDVKPDRATRRPCGCRIDPVVFGHADHLREALAL